jgi:hypothetical protein
MEGTLDMAEAVLREMKDYADRYGTSVILTDSRPLPPGHEDLLRRAFPGIAFRGRGDGGHIAVYQGTRPRSRGRRPGSPAAASVAPPGAAGDAAERAGRDDGAGDDPAVRQRGSHELKRPRGRCSQYLVATPRRP